MTQAAELSDEALRRAAGYALQEIAAEPGRLLTALRRLGYGEVGANARPPTVPDARTVASALGAKLLHDVAVATGQPEDGLAKTVGRQLGVVAVFAEIDGGRLEDNVVAVEKLIRSGRVDLFTR